MSNRYAATCSRCRGRVEARQGILTRRGNRWTVQHEACAKYRTYETREDRTPGAPRRVYIP